MAVGGVISWSLVPIAHTHTSTWKNTDSGPQPHLFSLFHFNSRNFMNGKCQGIGFPKPLCLMSLPCRASGFTMMRRCWRPLKEQDLCCLLIQASRSRLCSAGWMTRFPKSGFRRWHGLLLSSAFVSVQQVAELLFPIGLKTHRAVKLATSNLLSFKVKISFIGQVCACQKGNLVCLPSLDVYLGKKKQKASQQMWKSLV